VGFDKIDYDGLDREEQKKQDKLTSSGEHKSLWAKISQVLLNSKVNFSEENIEKAKRDIEVREKQRQQELKQQQEIYKVRSSTTLLKENSRNEKQKLKFHTQKIKASEFKITSQRIAQVLGKKFNPKSGKISSFKVKNLVSPTGEEFRPQYFCNEDQAAMQQNAELEPLPVNELLSEDSVMSSETHKLRSTKTLLSRKQTLLNVRKHST
jgi:hypothetical protein